MRNYKSLEEKKPALTAEELEQARAAFLSSGGTVQSVHECERKSRKTKKIISKYFRT